MYVRVRVCAGARANGVSSGASRTKMADITLLWSHDGRLLRCCWSLADYWVGGYYGQPTSRARADRQANGQRQAVRDALSICSIVILSCRRHVEWVTAWVGAYEYTVRRWLHNR